MVDASANKRIWLCAAGIFVAALMGLVITLGDLGVTWDEPVYQIAAWRAGLWLDGFFDDGARQAAAGSFSRESLHYHFIYGRFGMVFHPPGAGFPALITRKLCGWLFTDLVCCRLASAIQMSLVVAILYLFLARRVGHLAGFTAAASFYLMPRVFGHAHLFGTDIPAMFLVGRLCDRVLSSLGPASLAMGVWSLSRIRLLSKADRDLGDLAVLGVLDSA